MGHIYPGILGRGNCPCSPNAHTLNTHTHTDTHTLTHSNSLSHIHIHWHTHTHSHSLILTYTPIHSYCFTHSHPHPHSPSHSHSFTLTYTLTYTRTHTHTSLMSTEERNPNPSLHLLPPSHLSFSLGKKWHLVQGAAAQVCPHWLLLPWGHLKSVKEPVRSSPATGADPPLSSLSVHGLQESQDEWGPQAQLPHGFVRRLQSLGSEKEMKRPSYLPNMFYEKFCNLGYWIVSSH